MSRRPNPTPTSPDPRPNVSRRCTESSPGITPTSPAPRPDALPEGVVHVSQPLDRLTLRLDELADSFGISRRTLERERSAGRFPKPDLLIGKMPLWRPETIDRWIDGGGNV
jgi:predicted DNA-binding transcriptional regulator AlpA